MANLKVNVLERIKTANGWTMQKPVQRSHRGLFYLSWRENSKQIRRPCSGETLNDAFVEAERKRAQLLGMTQGLMVTDPAEQQQGQRLTLADATTKFLAEKSHTAEEGTVGLFKQVFADWGEFSKIEFMDEITTKQQVLDFGDFLQKKRDNCQLTAGWKMLRFNHFFKSAMNLKTGLITRKDAKIKNDADVVIFQPEEVKAYFDACDPEDHLLWSFFHKTGFREREVGTQTWDDLDLKRGTATVRERAADSLYQGFKYFRPKNGTSRTIKLPDSLVLRLRQWRLENPNEVLVFPTYNGKENLGFYRRCRAIAERAGIEGAHPHRWRATCATDLLRQNFDVTTVAKHLGHKDLKSTLRYLQAISAERMGDKMDAAWRSIDQQWMAAAT
jgi:integrase